MKQDVLKQQEKTCPKCGRKLWLRDFYKDKETKTTHSYCKNCERKMKRVEYNRNRKKPDGIFMHQSYGRLMEHRGLSLRIHWSGNMLSILRREFPRTKNEELAEMLGVSSRTVIRKARELGIEKDVDFVRSVWNENRLMAQVASRKSEKSGFKKGHTPWNKGLRNKTI